MYFKVEWLVTLLPMKHLVTSIFHLLVNIFSFSYNLNNLIININKHHKHLIPIICQSLGFLDNWFALNWRVSPTGCHSRKWIMVLIGDGRGQGGWSSYSDKLLWTDFLISSRTCSQLQAWIMQLHAYSVWKDKQVSGYSWADVCSMMSEWSWDTRLPSPGFWNFVSRHNLKIYLNGEGGNWNKMNSL